MRFNLVDIKHVFWDWNGTLVDDVQLTVEIMNKILSSQNLNIISIEKHKEIFDFPIEVYKKYLGFVADSKLTSSAESFFYEEYYKNFQQCDLQSDSEKLLDFFLDNKIGQSIISLLPQNILNEMVDFYKLENYFHGVIGQSNFNTQNKVESARNYFEKFDYNPIEILVIGDTTYDFEVAKTFGFHCALVSKGHQSHERLKQSGALVFNSLSEVLSY